MYLLDIVLPLIQNGQKASKNYFNFVGIKTLTNGNHFFCFDSSVLNFSEFDHFVVLTSQQYSKNTTKWLLIWCVLTWQQEESVSECGEEKYNAHRICFFLILNFLTFEFILKNFLFQFIQKTTKVSYSDFEKIFTENLKIDFTKIKRAHVKAFTTVLCDTFDDTVTFERFARVVNWFAPLQPVDEFFGRVLTSLIHSISFIFTNVKQIRSCKWCNMFVILSQHKDQRSSFKTLFSWLRKCCKSRIDGEDNMESTLWFQSQLLFVQIQCHRTWRFCIDIYWQKW